MNYKVPAVQMKVSTYILIVTGVVVMVLVIFVLCRLNSASYNRFYLNRGLEPDNDFNSESNNILR